MNVFVAGASGFVGVRVVECLLAAGHSVTALAHGNRSRSELQRLFPQLTLVIGNVSSERDIAGIVPPGMEAIIYLPGLLREFPKKGIAFQGVHVDGVKYLLDEARRVGARRWIQMSALGSKPNAATRYYSTKWSAEQLVRASGLDWTIVRPSVIFDDRPTKRMNFVSELANVARKAPVLPIFGDGQYKLQPVSLDDVAETIVQSLGKPGTIGEIYELAGPEQLTYEQIFSSIAKAIGRTPPHVHIPWAIIEPIAELLQGFNFFPITMDQITMLKEWNVTSDQEYSRWTSTYTLPLKQFGLSVWRQYAGSRKG